MIIDFLLYICSLFLTALGFALSPINFIIPDSLGDSFVTVLEYTRYFTGVFPVYEFFAIALFIVSFVFAHWAIGGYRIN